MRMLQTFKKKIKAEIVTGRAMPLLLDVRDISTSDVRIELFGEGVVDEPTRVVRARVR